MPALTVKNIPDDLYVRLKESAKVHHRSMNSEILYCVERTLGTHRIDVSEHLAIARKLRLKTSSHPITDDELSTLKNDGRP
jgi:plasmid stability protein